MPLHPSSFLYSCLSSCVITQTYNKRRKIKHRFCCALCCQMVNFHRVGSDSACYILFIFFSICLPTLLPVSDWVKTIATRDSWSSSWHKTSNKNKDRFWVLVIFSWVWCVKAECWCNCDVNHESYWCAAFQPYTKNALCNQDCTSQAHRYLILIPLVGLSRAGCMGCEEDLRLSRVQRGTAHRSLKVQVISLHLKYCW